MSFRLKRIPDEADLPEQAGEQANRGWPRELVTLQLIGLALAVGGFSGRFLFNEGTVLPLIGGFGWAFFGGATGAMNRITQVLFTFLAVWLAASLYFLVPDARQIPIAVGAGYLAGLISGIVIRRKSSR